MHDDMDYYDATSLYPWVNKTGKIPMGHPEIITEKFANLKKYEEVKFVRWGKVKTLYIF